MSKLTVLALAALAVSASPRLTQANETPRAPEDWLHRVVEEVCGEGLDGLAAQAVLPGAWFLEEVTTPANGSAGRIDQRFAIPNGELRLSSFMGDGGLRRFNAEIHESAEATFLPLFQVQTDGNCRPIAARRIVREGPERIMLDQLDEDFETLRWRETLQVPWPAAPFGKRHKGPVVALVDSGLAYDLPLFSSRLARGTDGTPSGFDFWDLDPLPYDGDTARNLFQPIRHGTPVASVIAREAPEALLAPFRYPRPDMQRMGDLIEAAAKAGARLLSISLGSAKREDWQNFEAAMRAHPEMLAIVSAGNDGRDVDAEPLWPGGLDLDNMIVVTSSDGFGRLADGSNWGANSVDLMVPAENIPVTDFRGSESRASGTSYAVPRVTALAARLLLAEPDLSTEALKQRIFARAVAPNERQPVVAKGFIIDPDRD